MPATDILLSTSDIIEILGIVATVLTSIVAICISVFTLRQNSKMLEESSRPYVTMTYEVIFNGGCTTFFMLKNYGNSSALITSFECTSKNIDTVLSSQFQKINDLYIAPGQRFLYSFNAQKFDEEIVTFNISYKSSVKTYSETIPLKIKRGIITTRSKDLNASSYALQEIAERLI